jgi:putative serine protease PepD
MAPQAGTPGAPPPPNWATPAPNGLPPYGSSESSTATGDGKRSGTRLAVTVAILAGLIGGGLGAGITYAVKGNGSNTTSSLGGSTNTANATGNGLNTSSANANQVTAVAAKILPSVVTISLTASDGSGDEGSGIIISSDGKILTNNHVVTAANNGDSMNVTFGNGKITPAKIVGTDLASDLAVIQASNVSGLTPATLGDSSTVVVGEDVVAVGAPLGLSNTVTSGIISALNRPVVPASDSGSQNNNSNSTQSVLDAIQTDASINPGNSGGPLVDMSGKVIGINSAIATASSGSFGGSGQSGSIGLGFAIPINQAQWIANELITNGKATHSLLGVSVGDPAPTATQAGAVVKTVSSGGAADKAGIKVGDVITKVDDQQTASADSLVAAIRSYKPGTPVTLTYVRGGQSSTTQVTLAPATS